MLRVLLPKGGLSLLAGKPKSEKSTLARQLAVCCSRPGVSGQDAQTRYGSVSCVGGEAVGGAGRTVERIHNAMVQYIEMHPGCTEEELLIGVTGNVTLK